MQLGHVLVTHVYMYLLNVHIFYVYPTLLIPVLQAYSKFVKGQYIAIVHRFTTSTEAFWRFSKLKTSSNLQIS